VGAPRQGRQDQEAFRNLKNLYVHFPFCRSKCSYCALYSLPGVSPRERDEYARRLGGAAAKIDGALESVYFGGGSPALCDLRPVLSALEGKLSADAEFTVELHPRDVDRDLLKMLRDGGVNRISMGVQSLDDEVLADMGRGYTFDEAERAFFAVKEFFDNAGIDLIVGYPLEKTAVSERHRRLAKWGLRHCSAYSLILEEGSRLARRYDAAHNRMCASEPALPDDDTVMDRLRAISRFLGEIGLERYEISNYAARGFECRHNVAVWRGEDYAGLGTGSHGRQGLVRTVNLMDLDYRVAGDCGPEGNTTEPFAWRVSAESDAKERCVFQLRTREGIDLGRCTWLEDLKRVRLLFDGFVEEGLLERNLSRYRLTARGYEVCDSIIEHLI
jgi:oxygen-independent coproporphyrinogen-3 oxidase